MIAAETLLIPLLQGFLWFDDSLQATLRSRGWCEVTRPQSMVMACVAIDVRRPADIARMLGVSRQAIHVTTTQLIDKGMIEVIADSIEGRHKRLVPSVVGEAMAKDAADALVLTIAELTQRIGEADVAALTRVFGKDWGAPPFT